MNAADLIQEISGKLGSTATVKSVFGEPIHVHGKTVVPVARVAYGFGAGNSGARSEKKGDGEGGGGGGGLRAWPAGALEITEDATRFVPVADPRRLLLALAAGVAVGALLFMRRRR